MDMKNHPPVYYSEYLQLDKILNAQFPESDKVGIRADDEMLFITVHQAYEIWFKLIIHELGVIRGIFKKPELADNSTDISNTVYRLRRICKILDLLVNQLAIVETMTPLDFLDFRDLLRPASGFQSIQFKIIEATLGLTYEQRFGKQYYLSQLKEEDIERVKDAEKDVSLIVLLNQWLERMPYWKDEYWNDGSEKEDVFWKIYRNAYNGTLSEAEKNNLENFDKFFMNEVDYPAEERRFSFKASRSALFIMLYRDQPLLHLPYELLNCLLEVDELMSLWRHRHVHMVKREIGHRVGTGGSTGAGYLKAAADSHHVFNELSDLTSFMLPRQDLPKLPETLIKRLGFNE